MSVRSTACAQPPTPPVALPYSGSFDITLDIYEIWNSTLDSPVVDAAPDGGSQISIRPFEQWYPTGLTIAAKLSGRRDFTAWTESYGDEEVTAVLGQDRWHKLRAVKVRGPADTVTKRGRAASF